MGDDNAALDMVLDLEHKGWDSLCRGAGGTFYGELMGEGALMVLVNGMVLDQPTIAATLNDSPAWASYSIDKPRLISTGETSAVLVYQARASREDDEQPFEALMSSHYSWADGTVTLWLYQQTTLTH